MRALTFQGVERLSWETVPDPSIRSPGDALVRVELAGLCGSDLHVYHGREAGLDVGTVMGHELVGEVVEVGAEVRSFRPADRVVSPFTTCCGACFYCRRGLTGRCSAGQLYGWVEGGEGLHGVQAEYARIPLADSTLVAVPAGLAPEVALFTGDILATGFFCAELAGCRPGEVAVVLGCGPVGLMAVVGARELGAERVLAVDSVPGRLALAEGFGAEGLDLGRGEESVVAAVGAATEGRGADAVLEAVGSPGASRLAIDLVRPGGSVAAVGVHTAPTFAFSPAEAYDKNLTFRTGRCPARAYMDRLLNLAVTGRYDLSAIVSHRMPLARGDEAYAMFAARTEGCTKVLLEPA
ncbi:MAG: alcohol dehydrogenase family protein [Acidobacteriota bacterium]